MDATGNHVLVKQVNNATLIAFLYDFFSEG
jgi:hypothetical protein